MLNLFRQLKLEYQEYLLIIKSGNFYLLFDEDAIIMNKIFDFKINDLKNNIKVGFPINSINKYLSDLDKLKINYLVIENKEVVIESPFSDNHYSNYKGSVFDYISINNKINNIFEYIKSISDKDIKKEIIFKINEIIKEY